MSQFNNSAQPSKRFGIAIVALKDFDTNKSLPAIFGFKAEEEQEQQPKSSTKSGNDVAYWQTILIMLFWILALLALIKLLSMTYKILSRVARLRNVTAALSNLKGKNETSSLSDSGYGITYTAADHNLPSYNEVTSEGSPSSSASLVTITTFLTETADSNSLAESGLGSLHRLDGGSFALSIITEEDDGEVVEEWIEDATKNQNSLETDVKKAVEQIEQKQGTDQIVPDVIVQSSNQESKKVVEKYQL